MLVVSDIDDVFLPKPNDLLVNLTESRAALEALLGKLNDMFAENHVAGSALGPALQAGFKLMVGSFSTPSPPKVLNLSWVQSPIGGKLVALTTSLPSVGAGALKSREDPKILGTPKVGFCCDVIPE